MDERNGPWRSCAPCLWSTSNDIQKKDSQKGRCSIMDSQGTAGHCHKIRQMPLGYVRKKAARNIGSGPYVTTGTFEFCSVCMHFSHYISYYRGSFFNLQRVDHGLTARRGELSSKSASARLAVLSTAGESLYRRRARRLQVNLVCEVIFPSSKTIRPFLLRPSSLRSTPVECTAGRLHHMPDVWRAELMRLPNLGQARFRS